MAGATSRYRSMSSLQRGGSSERARQAYRSAVRDKHPTRGVTTMIRSDVLDAIGHTPLIKLRRASEMTGCTILGKAEFMNPGESVKDRAARQIILEAETRGDIKPGGLVLEATAGNTGIGLAVVANARGYRTLIVIPKRKARRRRTPCAFWARNWWRC